MDFYTKLKYILMVCLAIIIGIAVINSDDTSAKPQVQQSQSKFNF